MPANPGTDRAARPRTHTPVPATHYPPLATLLPTTSPISPHPVTRLGPTFRKRTDQPTAASRRLFRGAEHAPPRKERNAGIYAGHGTEKWPRICFEWARDERGGAVGEKRECARGIPMSARKGWRLQTRPDNRQ